VHNACHTSCASYTMTPQVNTSRCCNIFPLPMHLVQQAVAALRVRTLAAAPVAIRLPHVRPLYEGGCRAAVPKRATTAAAVYFAAISLTILPLYNKTWLHLLQPHNLLGWTAHTITTHHRKAAMRTRLSPQVRLPPSNAATSSCPERVRV
jgi:hypothetical protein